MSPDIFTNSISTSGTIITGIREWDEASSVLLQGDGRIVVVGNSSLVESGDGDFVVVRYNPNGSLDTTFEGDGVALSSFSVYDSATDALIQPDGKLLVVGITADGSGGGDLALARYNSNGSLDTGFGIAGKVVSHSGDFFFEDPAAIALQPDGNIVVVSDTSGSGDFVVVRYHANGSLDSGFGSDGIVRTDIRGWDDESRGVVIQDDGKILVAGTGNASADSGSSDIVLVRYNSDGTLDTSFDSDGRVVTDFGGTESFAGLTLQHDGTIVVAGSSSTLSGGMNIVLARYHGDGSLDTTFDGDGRLITMLSGESEASDLQVLDDGRIVVSGVVNASAGSSGDGDFVVLRYNSNGTLDTGFGDGGKVVTDLGGDESTASLVLQPDGKIVMTGTTQTASGASDIVVMRYNSDGGMDTSFDGEPDLTPPFVTAAIVNGNVLMLSYNESLDSVNKPGAELFSVLVNGTTIGVSSVSVNGRAVLLQLDSSVAQGDSVTVSYTDPTNGNDVAAIQDHTGNDAAGFTAYAATNKTGEDVPYVLGAQCLNWYSYTIGYTVGTTHTFAINMIEPVTVIGEPILLINIGYPGAGNSHSVEADYTGYDSSTNSLLFQYTLTGDDTGQMSLDSIDLNGAVIIDSEGNPASVSLYGNNFTSNVTPAELVYATPVANGTTGEDRVEINASETGPVASLQAALSGITAGEGGQRDVLVLNITDTTGLGEGMRTSSSGNSVDVTIGGRMFRFVNVSGTISAYEVVSGVQNSLGTLNTAGVGGFERVLFNLVDSNGVSIGHPYSSALILENGSFTELPGSHGQFVIDQGSIFSDVMLLDSSSGLHHLIHPGMGDDTVTGSSQNDTCVIDNSGDDQITLGDGNDTFFWNGGNTSTFNGGSGSDQIFLSLYDSGIQYLQEHEEIGLGALGYQLQSDGLIHLYSGSVDFGTIEKGGGDDSWQYRITINSEAGAQGSTVRVSDIEQFEMRTHNDTLSLNLGGLDFDAPPNRLFATVDGNLVTLIYNESINTSLLPGTGQFTVMVGSTPVTVTSVQAEVNRVNLTLASPVASGQSVTVSYTDPTSGNDSNAVQDMAGNDAASFATVAAMNIPGMELFALVHDTNPDDQLLATFTISSFVTGRVLVQEDGAEKPDRLEVVETWQENGEQHSKTNAYQLEWSTVTSTEWTAYKIETLHFTADRNPDGLPTTISYDGMSIAIVWSGENGNYTGTATFHGSEMGESVISVITMIWSDEEPVSGSYIATSRFSGEQVISATYDVESFDADTMTFHCTASNDQTAIMHGSVILAEGTTTPIAVLIPDNALAYDNQEVQHDGLVLTHIITFDISEGMVVQPDGKKVVVGYSGTDASGSGDGLAVRYNTDGSLDRSFGSNGVSLTGLSGYDAASCVAIQDDGKIVGAGVWNDSITLIRLNANGTPDYSFGVGGSFYMTLSDNLPPNSITVQSDGGLLVSLDDSGGGDFVLLRVDADGHLDESFGRGDGMVRTAFPDQEVMSNSMTEQTDGKVILAGLSIQAGLSGGASGGGDSDFALARYYADGSLDRSFDADGRVTTALGGTEEANSVVVQADGKIIVAGYRFDTAAGSGSSDFAVVRYNANGSLDATFGGGDGIVLTSINGLDEANDVTVQSDGRIIVAGDTEVAEGGSGGDDGDIALVRYNADGSPDTSFGGGDGIVVTDLGGDEDVSSVTVQSDGKIVVSGTTCFSGGSDIFMVRYNTDGTIDESYGATRLTGTTVNGYTLTLKFNELLDSTHLPSVSDFTVTVGGDAVGLIGNLVFDNRLVLGVNTAVTPGQLVTVSYEDPTSGNDENAIQDRSGNDASGFGDVAAFVLSSEYSGTLYDTDGNGFGAGDRMVFTETDVDSHGYLHTESSEYRIVEGNDTTTTDDFIAQAIQTVTFSDFDESGRPLMLTMGDEQLQVTWSSTIVDGVVATMPITFYSGEDSNGDDIQHEGVLQLIDSDDAGTDPDTLRVVYDKDGDGGVDIFASGDITTLTRDLSGRYTSMSFGVTSIENNNDQDILVFSINHDATEPTLPVSLDFDQAENGFDADESSPEFMFATAGTGALSGSSSLLTGVILTFDELLDSSGRPDASAFVVRDSVTNTTYTINNVQVYDNKVALLLAATSVNASQLEVSYTVPPTGAVLQDVNGNRVAALSTGEVYGFSYVPDSAPVWPNVTLPDIPDIAPGQYFELTIDAQASDSDGDSIAYTAVVGRMSEGVFTSIPGSLTVTVTDEGLTVAGVVPDTAEPGDYVLRMYADGNQGDSNSGTPLDIGFTIGAVSETGPFMLVPDTNDAEGDTLEYTFNIGSTVGRLYDDDGNTVPDRLELYSYNDSGLTAMAAVSAGAEPDINTYRLTWSDNTHWTASKLEQILFDDTYDSSGRPVTAMFNDGGHEIVWIDAPVDNVVATISFSEMIDGVEEEAVVSLISTAGDWRPESAIYRVENLSLTITFDVFAWGYAQNGDVASMTLVVTGSADTDHIFSGTVVYENGMPIMIDVDETNNEPTGSVTVSGTATQGETLTASNNLGDADGLGIITYQWQIRSGENWSDIAGATSGSLKLTQSQVGHEVRVMASYTDDQGNDEQMVSDSTAVVMNVNEAPTAITLSSNIIVENSVTGTGVLIGVLTVADPDSTGNNNVLSLEGADSTSFEIRNGSELYFIGASPDYEAKGHYNVTVKSTDGMLTYSELYTVSVVNVNEAPLVNQMLTSIALEGESAYDLSLLQGVLDPDAGDVLNAQSVTFSIDGMLTGNNGQNVPDGMTLNGNVLTIDPANAVFDSLGDGVGRMISLDYTISDSHGATVHQVGMIAINGVNDAPTTTSEMVMLYFDEERVLEISDFGVYHDAEGSAMSRVKITDLPEKGELMYHDNGTTWVPVTRNQEISRGDLAAGYLKYIPEAIQAPVTIGFQVSDGSLYSELSSTLTVDVQEHPHHDCNVNITYWGNGEGLEGATALITEDVTPDETTAEEYGNGQYGFADLVEGDYTLSAAKPVTEHDRAAIDERDALAALDLVVGGNPNGDGLQVSSYQYLAADVNRDGTVGFRDVVGILRMALHREVSPVAGWAIVPDSSGSQPMESTHVTWPATDIAVTLDQDKEVELVGVLLGDVDGSWGS